MRKLKIHYAAAYNFLPFGPEGIEIFFDKLGNIVYIRGENKDVKPIDESVSDEIRVSSNGSGKSSTQDILAWTFYGKTVKNSSKIKSDGVIHNLIGKNCKTCVIVDKFRIERGRKPNFLRIWESEKHEWNDSTELSQGDMRVTQKKIEDIIGLSYEAFVNICVFTDDQSSCFLECDGPTKREIVENLLALGIYRHRHETANAELKTLKASIKTLSREFELFLGSKKDAEKRLDATIQKEKDWRSSRLVELKKLVEQAKEKAVSLQNSDTGKLLIAYQEAQEQIKSISPKIETLETAQDKRKKILAEAVIKENAVKEEVKIVNENVQSCQLVIRENQSQIKEREKFIAELNSNEPGAKCNKCWGTIDETNYEHASLNAGKDIDGFRTIINQELTKVKALTDQITKIKEKQARIKQAISEGETKFSDSESQLKKLRTALVAASQVREPKADSAELLLQQQIESLKDQAKKKKAEADGPSPFVDIIANDRVELDKATTLCDEKEKEVKDTEELVPYYEYWQKAYGDKGIRKWVIDGIIPALNNRIAYWLQYLIDNKISLKFDNELNETIERNPVDGDPYIYHAMSAGQRRRINLAVSQAFAHIMMISTGTVPSLIFLDEISTNIDPLGVQGLYNMIGELAQEKQVFITTHDPDLIRMLQGSDTLNLIHEAGITKLA